MFVAGDLAGANGGALMCGVPRVVGAGWVVRGGEGSKETEKVTEKGTEGGEERGREGTP